MGSLNISPKQPIGPLAARATGPRPSILSSWPTPPSAPAAARVRLPDPLVRISLLALIVLLTPLTTLSAGTAAPTFAFLLAAVLLALAARFVVTEGGLS